MSLFHFS